MGKTFLTEVKGWTPVIDILVKELGLMPALVYGRVWRYCQMKDKICNASLTTIAGYIGVSRKTVERHIKKLCEAGYLEDLGPDSKRHGVHVYADTGRIKIVGLVTAELGQTESLTSKLGQTESLTRSDRESDLGKTESLTKKDIEDRNEEREEDSNSKALSSISFDSDKTEEDPLCALMELTIKKLSRTFNDLEHLDSNITQAYNIWNETDLDEEFITKIEEAAKRTKQRANIGKKMAYFFTVLRKLLDIE